jgi:hypothetical protein
LFYCLLDFIEEDNPVNAANGKVISLSILCISIAVKKISCHIITNIYVGKPEFEVKNGAKPGVNEAQQNKTSDPKKNQKDIENDVSADDEEDSSESGSDEDSSEDEVSI